MNFGPLILLHLAHFLPLHLLPVLEIIELSH